MAKRAAIRNEGQRAESEFLRLVQGSRKSDSDKKGDVIVVVDGKEHYVEVKHCEPPGKKSESVNQVRAIKYIPCVVFAPKRSCWYVLSADQLVRLAASKSRGQHTEIAFECMLFNLKSLPEDFHVKATDAELANTVQAAIRRGMATNELQTLMESLLDDIIAVKDRYIAEVRRIDGSR